MAMPSDLSIEEGAKAFLDLLDEPETEDIAAQKPDPDPTPEDEPNDPEPNEDLDLQASDDTDDSNSGDEEKEPEEEDLISTLDQLAEQLDVKPEEFMANIEVEAPDGEKVSLGEALESWSIAENTLRERGQALDNQFDTLKAKHNSQVNEKLASLEKLTGLLVSELNQQYTTERLQELKLEDPDAYLAAVDRKRKVQQLADGTIAALEQEATFQTNQSDEDMTKVLARENTQLLKKKPEWQDKKIRGQAMMAGEKLLRSIGFSTNEIDGVTDHKLLVLVDYAVKGARLEKGTDSKKIEALRKRGLKRPSMGLRSRERRDAENPKHKDRQETRSRLKRYGDPVDAAKLFEEFI